MKDNPADVVVCPEQLPTLKTLFRTLTIPFDVTVENLERTIKDEQNVNNLRLSPEMNWEAYQRLATVRTFLGVCRLLIITKKYMMGSFIFVDIRSKTGWTAKQNSIQI